MRVFAVVVVLVVSVLVLVGCGGGGVSGSPQARPSADADLLFVQSARSGRFVDGEVTLVGVSAVTTWFSERPARDSSAMATADFVADFAGLFGDDPPNGTISSLDEGVGEFVVELSSPRYDEDTETLSYRVVPIGADPVELPEAVGPVSVFIDSASGVTVRGVVLSGDMPLPDVTVSLSGPVSASSTSDDRGGYSFESLPAGDYVLSASYGCCGFANQGLDIPSDSPDFLDIDVYIMPR